MNHTPIICCWEGSTILCPLKLLYTRIACLSIDKQDFCCMNPLFPKKLPRRNLRGSTVEYRVGRSTGESYSASFLNSS